MIKHVIFDLDGTLTDTEKYYRKAWPIALKHFGYEMKDEQALYLRSLGRPFAPEKFKEWYGEDFDYWAVRNYRKEIVQGYIDESGIPLKKGAIEILTYLKEKGICRALATANNYGRAERILKQVGLFEHLDQIICADMVERGKPAPDIYKYAVEKLNAKPEECLAVEDSPNGIRSAYLAGCKPVFVPDQTGPNEDVQKEMYACVGSLLEIKNLID